MQRQPQPGSKAYILGKSTYSKLMTLIKRKDPSFFSEANTDTNIVTVVNKSAGYLDPYTAVEISESSLAEDDDFFSQYNAFEATTVNSSSKRIGILQKSADVDEAVEAVVGGVTVCNATIGDLSHRFLTPLDDGRLVSGFRGPIEILNTPTATGAQDIKVRLGTAANDASPASMAFGDVRITTELSGNGVFFNRGTNNPDVFDISGGGGLSVKKVGYYTAIAVGELSYSIVSEPMMLQGVHTTQDIFYTYGHQAGGNVTHQINCPSTFDRITAVLIHTRWDLSNPAGTLNNSILPTISLEDFNDTNAWFRITDGGANTTGSTSFGLKFTFLGYQEPTWGVSAANQSVDLNLTRGGALMETTSTTLDSYFFTDRLGIPEPFVPDASGNRWVGSTVPFSKPIAVMQSFYSPANQEISLNLDTSLLSNPFGTSPPPVDVTFTGDLALFELSSLVTT